MIRFFRVSQVDYRSSVQRTNLEIENCSGPSYMSFRHESKSAVLLVQTERVYDVTLINSRTSRLSLDSRPTGILAQPWSRKDR